MTRTYDPAPPLTLGKDAELVAACLAQGGFPRAQVLSNGYAVWLGPDDRMWRGWTLPKAGKRGRA